MNDFETDFLQERFELARERLSEIIEEKVLPEELAAYFHETTAYLHETAAYLLDPAKVSLPVREAYEKSYLNPAYAREKLGVQQGNLLSFVYYEITELQEKCTEEWIIRAELLLEIYSSYVLEWQDHHTVPDSEALRSIIYWYAFDYADVAAEQYVQALSGEEEGKACLYSHSVLYGFLPQLAAKEQLCNEEADRDHRDDVALILDKGYVSRKLEVFRTALEKCEIFEDRMTALLKYCDPGNLRFEGEKCQIWKEYCRQLQNILKKCCTSSISLVN